MSAPPFSFRCDGLTEQEASCAKEEISLTLTVTASLLTPQQRLVAASLVVWVTDEYEEAVRATYLEVRGIDLPQRPRSEMVAVGQTLEGVVDGKLGVVVLVPSWFWSGDGLPMRVLMRHATCLHEFAHYCLAVARHSDGADLDVSRRGSFHEALARIMWDECCAEQWADDALRKLGLARTHDGTVLGTREAQTEGLLPVCRGLLQSFSSWEQEVREVREDERIGAACSELLQRERSLFECLARLMGSFGGSRVDELPALLGQVEGFALFLREEWDAIVDALSTDETAARPRIAACLGRVRHRIGVRVGIEFVSVGGRLLGRRIPGA